MKTALLLVLGVGLPLLVICSSAKQWTDCGSDEDWAEILDVKISNETLHWGDTLTTNITYNLKKAVSNVTVTIDLKHGVIPSYENTVDLCKSGTLNCPLKAGCDSVIIKQHIQPYKARGSYEIHAVVKYPEMDVQLACLDFHLNIED